jgi:spermidine synthase
LFRFLSDCGEDPPIVLGDARLTLAASNTHYDLIVLDAFSSDAIPVHLLTREAMAGYLSRLSPHGVLLFHISNRHLDLLPVVAAEAAAEGLVVIAKVDDRANDTPVDYRSNALVAVLSRSADDLGDLPNRSGWVAIRTARAAPWTDDYSDVLGALLQARIIIRHSAVGWAKALPKVSSSARLRAPLPTRSSFASPTAWAKSL